MKRPLALVGTIVLLMTLVAGIPAAAKNVVDEYNVMGPGARAHVTSCTHDVPDTGDWACTTWQVDVFLGWEHYSWADRNDPEFKTPGLCAYADVSGYDALEQRSYSTYRGGCLDGKKLSLAVAKDLSSASADVTVPTITSSCVGDECTPEVVGDPLVVDVEWIGEGPVTSEKWRQTSDQGSGCYSVESIDGDNRSATASGTMDGVQVTFDSENTLIFEGHQTYKYICPK